MFDSVGVAAGGGLKTTARFLLGGTAMVGFCAGVTLMAALVSLAWSGFVCWQNIQVGRATAAEWATRIGLILLYICLLVTAIAALWR